MALSNPKISSSAKELLNASAAIQTYVAAILRQADIKLDALPDLPKYQATARQHAENWSNQLSPAIIKTNTDIIDYSNHFRAFYDTLKKLAEKIDNGDKEAVKTFTDGLGLLRNNVSRKEESAKYLKIQLQDFKSQLSLDHDDFTKEANAAAKELEGDDGELKDLSNKIDNINSKLNELIGAMAGGATAIVGGIALILVGAFAEIETDGLSTGLILAGIGTLGAGIGAEIGGGVEYGLAVEEKKALQEKLSSEKSAIGTLKHVKSLLDGFVSQMDAAISSVEVLEQQWTVLSNDLTKVITDLDRNPGSLGLVAILNAAKGDWEEALSLAQKMIPTGEMNVKEVNNLMDVIHTNQKPKRSS
jgi:predicted phage tail protein